MRLRPSKCIDIDQHSPYEHRSFIFLIIFKIKRRILLGFKIETFGIRNKESVNGIPSIENSIAVLTDSESRHFPDMIEES